jgi:hypothetical protein
MTFEKSHLKFINGHLSSRPEGERRARLEREHRHAEILFLNKVWWPLQGHFHVLPSTSFHTSLPSAFPAQTQSSIHPASSRNPP